MPKRDRAAYMRAYRAKRARREGVSTPSPVGELRDVLLPTKDYSGTVILAAVDAIATDPPSEIVHLTQTQRDAILRKVNRH